MIISQFFVVSLRGDIIASRDYSGDVHKVKTSAEVFYRKVKFWDSDGGSEAPPAFTVDGVHYLHVKIGGVFLVATTRRNVSPPLVFELLNRIANIIKDYCGVITEESIRLNFVLVYELLDEIVDYGCPQNTSTEVLKRYILNEPVLPPKTTGGPGGAASLVKRQGISPQVLSKSVLSKERDGKKKHGEIFVDVVENLSMTFNSSGYIQNSAIDGTIQVRSYMSSSPMVKIALNDNLQIAGRTDGGNYGGHYGVYLDDCNFHECVNLDRFDMDRTVTLKPSQGEFALMNYRTTRDVKPPFRVSITLQDVAPFKVELTMKVKADYANNINAPVMTLSVPVPKSTLSVSFPEIGAASGRGAAAAAAAKQRTQAHFQEREKLAVFTLRKVQGGSEHMLRARVSLNNQASVSIKKEIGPVSLNFSLPMYNASKLSVKYLQVVNKDKGQSPARWVRYVTESSSYICRF